MAQQINLYSPILLLPRRHFSARKMAEALSVLVLGVLVLAGWSTTTSLRLKREMAAVTEASAKESERLAAALQRSPTPTQDTLALEQELVQAKKRLAERRELLAELAPQDADPQRGNAALLRFLAQSVPASIWLSEIKRTDDRIEIAGTTQQPEALRPWLAQLATHPAAAGQVLRSVKVERSDAEGGEAWTFRVVSARAPGGPS